jgi:DNA invertase Pin-like site-specific DNA recombinase
MTTYGYIRVSTTEQVDGTSLEEQRRQIAGNALTAGLSIDRWLEDGGVSGADPFFDRLGSHGVALQKGDTIIVAKLDRFSRDLLDALQSIKECKRIGVKLIVNGHGDVTDESNIYAQLMLEIMFAFSSHERRVIKERQRTGQAAKRARGGHIGGSAPFGYRVEGTGKAARLVADQEQQRAITEARELHSQGHSLRAIAQHIRVAYGASISHEAVRRIVSTPPLTTV